MPLSKKLVAEFIGTFWLVLGGCGSAVLAAGFPELGIGFVGVSLAFGLTVLTMAYAIGHISGCHLNPAVSFGLWTSGRFATKELIPYIVAQVLGGIAGAGILYLIASGKAGFGSIQNGSETDQMWILVPVLPWIPSLAFSRRVIMAVRPSPEAAKSIAACTFGSMEPGAN